MKTTNYYKSTDPDGNVIVHYGIKGMKKGVRRFQREDGTYTSAGMNRYDIGRSTPSQPNRSKSVILRKRISYDYNNPGAGIIDAKPTIKRRGSGLGNGPVGNNQNAAKKIGPYVSKEYREEMAYNSKKNSWTVDAENKAKQKRQKNKEALAKSKQARRERVKNFQDKQTQEERDFYNEEVKKERIKLNKDRANRATRKVYQDSKERPGLTTAWPSTKIATVDMNSKEAKKFAKGNVHSGSGAWRKLTEQTVKNFRKKKK